MMYCGEAAWIVAVHLLDLLLCAVRPLLKFEDLVGIPVMVEALQGIHYALCT